MRMLPFLCVALLAACVLATTATPANAQSLAMGPWWNTGLPRVTPRPFTMPRDPDLQFIIRDGVRGQEFATGCSSIAAGTAPITDPTRLPVGNGWTLACSIAPTFVMHEQMFQGRDGSFHCWKGVATAYRTVSDPRLQVQVTTGASGQPWWLQATSSTAWWVQPISFSIGRVWPLWLEVSYQTIDFAPARGGSCTGVLR